MKTSVIIPCHHSHFPFLENLLTEYENQTVLPDEVIISLSQADEIDPLKIDSLLKKKHLFFLKLLTTKEKKTSGENRNIAGSNASGRIFLYNDSDDIPHRQRVELVTTFFKNHKIDVLFHGCIRNKDPFFYPLDSQNIKHIYTTHFLQTHLSLSNNKGQLCTTSTVFEQIKWKDFLRAQDQVYNKMIYDHFNKIMLIDACLMQYRAEYSTFLNLKNKSQNFTSEDLKKLEEDQNQIDAILNGSFSQEHLLAIKWMLSF